MKEKIDVRTQNTIDQLKKSLTKLLSLKPLNEITIKELCFEAKINRVTFYDHFDNIRQLYEEVENDVFAHFTTSLTSNEIESYEDFYDFIIEFLMTDKNLGKMFLQNEYGKFPAHLEDFFIKGCIKIWQEEKHLTKPDEKTILLASYRVNGIMGLFRQWILNDYKIEKQEFKKIVVELDSRVDSLILF